LVRHVAGFSVSAIAGFSVSTVADCGGFSCCRQLLFMMRWQIVTLLLSAADCLFTTVFFSAALGSRFSYDVPNALYHWKQAELPTSVAQR